MIKNCLLKFFCIILLQIIGLTPSFAAKITTLEGKYASDVAFFDEEGKKVFLDQFEGKTVLLVFWATWCAPCLKEMPDLDVLQKDFRKLPFEILAVSEDFQGVAIVKDYFHKQEIRHLKIYHDYGNALFKDFSVAGLPTAFIIDPDGKIVVSFKGAVNWHDDEVRRLLLSHIPGNPVEPKNSYKEQSLNQQIRPAKVRAELDEKIEPEEKQEEAEIKPEAEAKQSNEDGEDKNDQKK